MSAATGSASEQRAELASAAVTDELLDTTRIEQLIGLGFVIGATLLLAHGVFGASAKTRGGRLAKVAVELQRKAFHMIGGCIICSTYHFGIKFGLMVPASLGPDQFVGYQMASPERPVDAALIFISGTFICWVVEAARLLVPAVQTWYLGSFKGLVREKEIKKAAGIAYFLPGALAAMMSAPSNLAVLGILFLSIGDACSSLGTAAGVIPVGSSARKVEGSIACFFVCTALGAYAGLSVGVAATTAGVVTVGEVLAEVIGLDDNFVLPILTVLGVRLAFFPNLWQLLLGICSFFAGGILLGITVAATTPKDCKKA